MSLFTPAHRATVYAPRSVDPTETTILTGSGAVHSDPFKITTAKNLAGWKPYLHEVEIRRGAIDLFTRKVAIPQCRLRLRDQRITEGGSNLQRWFTGILGPASGNGRVQVSRCKIVVEESYDYDESTGTGTWATCFTGRINAASIHDLLGELIAQGMSKELLRARVFHRRPHSSVTYAVESSLIPLGITSAFGSLPAAPVLRGVVGNSSTGVGKSVILDATSVKNGYNVITRALRQSDGRVATIARGAYSTLRPYDGTARVRLKNGVSIGDFRLLGYKMFHREEGHFSVSEIALEALDVGSENYLALPADGTTVEIGIRPALQEPSQAAPLFLSDVHPAQFWADLLDGKFGDLTTAGAVYRSYARNVAAFNTLIADPSFGTLRCKIEGPDKLTAFAEGQINKTSGLVVVEDELGQMVPLDLRLPQSLAGLSTLTDADLVDTDLPDWEHSAEDAISRFEVVSYVDDTWAAEDFAKLGGFFPDIPACLVESYSNTKIVPDFSSGDNGEQTLRIDAKGFRASPAEVGSAALARQEQVQAQVLRCIEDYRLPFAAGPQRVRVVCKRTTTVRALRRGNWVLAQLSRLPDPATNLRGGTRLFRILDIDEKGPKVTLMLLDAGPNATCTAPTGGAIGAGSDAKHEITVPVTLNAAGEPVRIEVALTATSVGVRPGATDPLWQMVRRVTATGTTTIRNLVPGMRAWVRYRSEPSPNARDKALASAWAFPGAGTGYQDLTVLSAFSSVSVAGITSKAADITINLGGNTTDYVRLLLASASSKAAADALTTAKLVDLPPGTTLFRLSGLDQAGANWWFKVEVAPFDGVAGQGASVGLAATSFQATGTAAQCPKVAGVSALGGTIIVPAVAAFDRKSQIVRMGVAFNVLPGALGLDLISQRAPDSGGSPGTPVDMPQVAASKIPKEGFAYLDELPANGATWWYRFAHRGDGYTDGDWTEWIAAIPGILPREDVLLKAPGAVPRDRPMAGGARSVLQLQTWLWPNAEMDLWEADGITPAGHTVDLTAGAVVSRVSAPDSGDYALKYKNPDNATNSGWHGISTLDPVKGAFCMPLRPGVRYRMLIKSRASVVATGKKFRVTLDFGTGGTLTKEFVYEDLGHTAGAYGALFEHPFTVPTNADPNTKGVMEFNRNGDGADVEFELDSIRMDEETTDYEVLSQQIQDQGYGVAVNGDFERGRAFWEEFKSGASTSVLSLDTVTKDKGTRALKITVTAVNSQTLIRQSRRSTDEHVKTLDTDVSTLLATRVREGDVIQARGSLRISAAGPQPRLGFRTYSTAVPSGAGTGVILCNAGSPSIGAFESITGFYVVPAGVQWVVPYIQIDGQDPGETVWVDDVAIGRLLTLPHVKVYNPTFTDIVCTNNIAKILTFSTEQWDVGGFHSTVTNPSRLTIPGGSFDGYFDLCAQVTFEANSNNYRRLRILKNGSIQLAIAHFEAVSVEMGCQIFAMDDNPSPGDYYEVEALQTSGGNLNVVGGNDATPNATKTWFAMAYRR